MAVSGCAIPLSGHLIDVLSHEGNLAAINLTSFLSLAIFSLLVLLLASCKDVLHVLPMPFAYYWVLGQLDSLPTLHFEDTHSVCLFIQVHLLPHWFLVSSKRSSVFT